MNFFNEIDKVSYNKETKDPIQLIEYINFKDEKTQEKYLLFKFRNNLNQIATAMKVEVKQFDEENNLVEKTVFSYDCFKAKAQEIFVPTAKLKVNYNTSYIEAKLLNASFETIWWNGEALLPIKFTEDDIKKEYIKEPVEEKPKKANKVKKSTIPSGHRKTKYKDVTKSNKPKLPKILTVILSIAILAVSVYSVFRLKGESKYIHDNQFEYQIIDSDEIKIINYMGNNIEVTIPAKYKKYNVTSIEKEAFKDASITKVNFKEGSLNIAASAFSGCALLSEINDQYGTVKNVSTEAFKDCISLKTVILPNATIASLAFENCLNVKELRVKDFVLDSVYSAFNVGVYLNALDVKQGHISKNFFIGVNTIHTLILSGSSYVDYDALNDIALKAIRIDKYASVSPECLAGFISLNVELNKDNTYKPEDYQLVNSNLKITTWVSVSE